MTPNQDQITGILRVLIPVICTWLAAKGFTVFSDTGIVGDIITVVVSLIAMVWAVMTHTDSAKIKSAAAIDPQLQIQVPRSLMIDNKKVASLVHDDTVPNVTRLNQS